MDTKRPQEGSQSQPGKYRIYLVGFPNIISDPEAISVSKLIEGLVPEANVVPHNIFHSDSELDLQHSDADNEQAPEGNSNDLSACENESEPSISTADRNPGHNGARENPTSPRTNSNNIMFIVSDDGGTPFRGIRRVDTDAVSTASSIGDFQAFSPGWLENEALGLLSRIQKHRNRDGNIGCCQVLLAGYGFGGLVVKQVVIMANTTPRFYNVAFDLEGLVFFATPHRSTGRLAWEEVLLDMIKGTGNNYRGRLSQILSELVNSVSRLSHVFYRFTSKYPITNFISSGQSDKSGTLRFNSTFENVVYWTDYNGDKRLTMCAANDLRKLESLRAHFAPRHVLLNLHKETVLVTSKMQPQPPGDVYFRALQALSPSRYFLYENRTLYSPDDLNNLSRIYRSWLNHVRLENIRGGSVQVTGPSNYGRSALVKLISQRLREDSSVVVVDNFVHSSKNHPCDLYTVYTSFLHQILSQRPSLLHPVENLVARILDQGAWPEEAIRLLLSSILSHAEDMNLIMVICDMESWPSPIRSWWSKIQNWLPQTSKCTLVTSSNTFDNNLTPHTNLHFDLGKRYGQYKQALIKAIMHQYLDTLRVSTSHDDALNEAVQRDIIAAAKSFRGSYTSINVYLSRLFRSLTLSAPRAVNDAISNCRDSEEQLYRKELKPFQLSPSPVSFWALSTLSWVLFAVRPLHVKELAAAVAIDLSCNTKLGIRENISIDMEHDIRNHLSSFLAVENQYVRFISPMASKMFLEHGGSDHSQADTHYRRTLSCLHYLQIVLADDSPSEWEKCLSYVSYKQHTRDPPDPVLEFLHYSCLFWPAHFLQVETPYKDIINKVAEFLQRPKVCHRWFELYLLCTGAPCHDLTKDRVTVVTSGALRNATEDARTTSDRKDQPGAGIETREWAAKVAGYIGLAPVVLHLLDMDQAGCSLKVVPVRHGHSQHSVILDTLSQICCLESFIANDDDERVKQLLEADREGTISYFPLHMAALAGSPKTVYTLFSLVHDPAQKNEDGQSPLHVASIRGNMDIIRFLLGEDIPEGRNRRDDVPSMVDILDANGQTPLVLATRMGNIEAAKYLAGCSTLIKTPDKYGKTALHYAVVYCPQVVEAIVVRDPTSLLTQDNDGCTPLHTAVQVNSTMSASAMANATRGDDYLARTLEVLDNGARTVLHYIAEFGAIEIARILNDEDERWSTIITQDANGDVPAELAARCGHLETMRLIASWMREDSGNQMLLAASKAGQLLVVQHLLEDGISPNEGVPKGSKPLLLAASEGHEAIVLALLQKGALINLEDSDRQTALHHAAAKGNCNVIQALLAWGSGSSEKARINTPNSLGYTPLHLAARAGQIQTMALLLDRGADKGVLSRERQSPLHLAVESAQAVELLLGKGAAVNGKDSLDQTPLHLAVRKNNLESAKALINRGADLSAKDNEQMIPLFHAIIKNNLEIVKEFFKVTPEASLNQIWESLKLAVTHSAVNVARFIMSENSDAVIMTNDQANELLYSAAGRDCSDLLGPLVDLGADVKQHWGLERRTPLHVAVFRGMVKNMGKIIELGADVDATDIHDQTPLHVAAGTDKPEAISVLLSCKASINAVQEDGRTPIFIAAYRSSTEAARVLLDGGADITICDSEGWSPLHAAADSLEIALMLVEHNADINYPREDGRSPLHFSSSWGRASVVHYFLQNGGNPNLADKKGNTPFHLALMNGDSEVVRVMLEHDGNNVLDLDSPDSYDRAPIHRATLKDWSTVVQLLLDKGVKTEARTKTGETCLSMAVRNGLYETLRVLLRGEEPSPPGTGWDYSNLVAAYWEAISVDQPNSASNQCMQILLNKEQRLLKETSNEGDNGLETYFSYDWSGELGKESGLLALLLIRRGINPFHRRPLQQASAFELGMGAFGRNDDYITSCFKYIPTELEMPSPALGFRELRIATELENTDLWERLEPLRDCVKNETDQDGWTIEHFLIQSVPRLGFGEPGPQFASGIKTPTAIFWPPTWEIQRPDTGPGVEIFPDGLGALFEGRKHNGNQGKLSVRANFPFRPRKVAMIPPYFEVTIVAPDTLPKLGGDDFDAPAVSIGFCGEFTRLFDAHTGWRSWSLGFHGDDGHIYEESNYPTVKLGKLFGPGNTVGCGVDYAKGEYLFTLDGEVVGRYPSNLIYRKLYPTIGHSYGVVEIKVNFGESDFVWKDVMKLNPERGGGGLRSERKNRPT